MTRPRPVLLLAAIIAGLNAFVAAGDLLNILPPKAVTYVALASIVVTAIGGVLVQGVVTPLSAPRNGNGTPLVPASDLLAPVKAAARAGAHGGVTEVVTSARVRPPGGTVIS